MLKSYGLPFLLYASEAVLLSNTNISWITVLIVRYLKYLVLKAMIVFQQGVNY